jgi:hypothetical protein
MSLAQQIADYVGPGFRRAKTIAAAVRRPQPEVEACLEADPRFVPISGRRHGAWRVLDADQRRARFARESAGAEVEHVLAGLGVPVGEFGEHALAGLEGLRVVATVKLGLEEGLPAAPLHVEFTIVPPDGAVVPLRVASPTEERLAQALELAAAVVALGRPEPARA